MSIAIVQVGAGVSSSGSSLSQAITLAGVTAADALIAVVGHEDGGSTNPNVSGSDAQGSYTQDIWVARGNQASAGIYSLFNANAGSHTLTVTASSGTAANSAWNVNILEVSGLGTTDSFDASSSNTANTSTTPTTGSTGTLAVASEFVITCAQGNQGSTGGTSPPTGGNNSPFIDIYNATSEWFDSAYQINTSVTTGVAAAYGTLNTSVIWAAVIGTYKAFTSIATPTTLMGQILT